MTIRGDSFVKPLHAGLRARPTASPASISTGRNRGERKSRQNMATLKICCNGKAGIFSINRITEAIHDAIVKAMDETDGKLLLHECSEFGGSMSAAFREGLVREYNATHMKDCPKCGLPLLFTADGTADCRHCKTNYTFPKEGAQLCYISEEGMAEFVGRRIGNGFASRTGDYYYLGAVGGRSLYYGTAPNRQFYTKHKGDKVALVLGSNHAEVPESWIGHVVPFCELFYLNEANGEIRVDRNRLRELIPSTGTTRPPAGERKVHKRRSDWLMFIANLLCSPYRDSDFHLGNLKPRVARDWFVKNKLGAPKNVKEYQRDLYAFRHLDNGANKPDKREKFIVLLLRTAADKARSPKERMGIARAIPELVDYLQKAELKNHGRPVEITRGAWQYCRDNTKEYVPVTDIEKFFDELDEKNVCSA